MAIEVTGKPHDSTGANFPRTRRGESFYVSPHSH